MSRAAWVTGAGKGLGRALSLELARRGCGVAASARTESDLTTLGQDAKPLAGAVYPFPLDVTDEDATKRAADAIEAKLGPLDVAILNAGTHVEVFARDFDSQAFRTLVDVNIMGVVHGLAALLPRFIERGSGQIVVVASVAGYRGLPSSAAYGASKAALINMCESLKPELDGLGVRLSLVNPGFVRTPLTDRNPFPMPFLMEPEDAARRLVDGIASRRFETTFPRRFTWMMKVLRGLPYALYFPLTRRLVRDREERERKK
jgi:NAD(P)-dependent dehydrogenase (short-subunit alcohol dehydrogenase family)